MDDLIYDLIWFIPVLILAVILNFSASNKKKKGKTTIDDVIKNDPVLNKLDKEIEDINKEVEKELIKDRKTVALMKARGIDIDDEDFKFDKKEVLNDFKEILFDGGEVDELLSFIDERLKFEKRITKSNYTKIESLFEKWQDFRNDEYDEWDDFEDEDEMKELQIKKEKFETKENKIKNEIFNFLSKVVKE